MKALLVATVQSHICQFHKLLMKLLKEHGYEIHVAAKNNLAEKNGLQMEYADYVYDVPFRRSPFDPSNIAAYKQLKSIIEANHYDVIHCNTPVGGIVTRIASNRFRKRGTRIFYTAHGFHFYKGAPTPNWVIYYPIEKIMSLFTDKIITINAEDYSLSSNKMACKTERIHGIGANSDRFQLVSVSEKMALRNELKIPADAKVILNVGELLPNKNQVTAIAAMKSIIQKIPNCVLLIAGNGPEKNNLERTISEMGLSDHVRLLGYTTIIEKYMQASDMLFACSIREGLGMNVIEAMLCGIPVVASSNRGHSELIKEGINGHLVKNIFSPDEFGEKACDVLNNKFSLPNKIHDSVIMYTSENVVKELAYIYGIEE